MNKAKILLVDWVDSCQTAGWQEERDCKVRVISCQTAGFLVEETKEAVCLALSRALTEGCHPYGDIITIPRCSITGTEVMKEGI